MLAELKLNKERIVAYLTQTPAFYLRLIREASTIQQVAEAMRKFDAATDDWSQTNTFEVARVAKRRTEILESRAAQWT
jgi:acyl-CoA reductase-like NAD-dependent aldehyde dehydrogenase